MEGMLFQMFLYELKRAGIDADLPMAKAVARLNPGSSADSAKQRLNKRLDMLLNKGHLVPPPGGRLGAPGPEHIRGRVRDESGETRYVTWKEVFQHRRRSRVEEGVIRGSGQYRRVQAMKARGILPNTPTPIRQRKLKTTRNTLPKLLRSSQENALTSMIAKLPAGSAALAQFPPGESGPKTPPPTESGVTRAFGGREAPETTASDPKFYDDFMQDNPELLKSWAKNLHGHKKHRGLQISLGKLPKMKFF